MKDCLVLMLVGILFHILTRDVEAVKSLMLPLHLLLKIYAFEFASASSSLEFFSFRLQLQLDLIASELASASNVFHQSASASVF